MLHQKYPECDLACVKYIDEAIELEGGGEKVAGIIFEPVTGANGIIVPPPEYFPKLREICDRWGVLMIADEVMSGFGRTGKWFAVDHWKVVPDIMTMAKGLTSAMVPLGAVGMRPQVAAAFRDRAFPGGLTYNSHPLGCAAANATLAVYEEEDLIARAARMGEVLRARAKEIASRHPSVGATRSIGLFGIFELVRDRATYEPMTPYNGSSEEMAALAAFLRENGLYTFVRWNTFFTNPPLIVTEAQLEEGLAIVDRALEITDRAAR
jgi:taurine--2-oxoglutarate transaminase